MTRMTIPNGTRVHVNANVLNAYLLWRGQQPVTVGAPGTVVGKAGPGYLVKLDTPLPSDPNAVGPARVVRNTVTARAQHLTPVVVPDNDPDHQGRASAEPQHKELT